MALKGSATIELTNADGSKEIIQHDNMLTNAINDLMKSYRGALPLALKLGSKGSSYAKNLFGGIMLFDEVLNADADDYYIPTTKVTGYASQDAYSGIDPFRGSLNELESGVQEDGSYKFVWDFATSQANGNIKSLALVPNVMGKIGMTNITPATNERISSNIDYDAAPFDSNGYTLKNGTTDGIDNNYFKAIAIIDNIVYALDKTQTAPTNTIKIYRFNCAMDNVSLTNLVAMSKYIDTTEITLPTDFYNQLTSRQVSYYFDRTDNKLYMYPTRTKTNIQPNGTMLYIDVDLLNNFRITTHTFTNTSPYPITLNSFKTGSSSSSYASSTLDAYGQQSQFFACKDYVVYFSYKGKIDNTDQYCMYVTSPLDNTQIIQVTNYASKAIFFTDTICLRPLVLNNNILVFAYANDSYGSPQSLVRIVDLNTGIYTRCNAIRNYFGTECQVQVEDKCTYWSVGTQQLTLVQRFNPFILMTKNNLDSPVVKTASQTMKITYILTEQEGAV